MLHRLFQNLDVSQVVQLFEYLSVSDLFGYQLVVELCQSVVELYDTSLLSFNALVQLSPMFTHRV